MNSVLRRLARGGLKEGGFMVKRFLPVRLAMCAALAAIIPACGSGGGGGGAVVVAVSSTIPVPPAHPVVIAGTPGTNSITTGGGTGSASTGGTGGPIALGNYNGSDSWILKTGTIDTTFAMPSGDPDLGSNPLTVDVTATLALADGVTTILGDDAATTATGLWIKPGVTLTLTPNWPAGPASIEARLVFAKGILIEGTLKTDVREAEVHQSNLLLQAANLKVRAGGAITTAGADNGAAPNGSNGGAIYLNIAYLVTQEGTITSTGGSGDAGGNGGSAEMYSRAYAVYNLGPITTSGGTGTNGLGGNAGFLWIQGSTDPGSPAGGGVFNTGNLTARGGNGTAGGGNGHIIMSRWDYSDGPLVNTATLDASGGDATAVGNGGNAGGTINTGISGLQTAGIYMIGEGGSVRVMGTIRARGGNGAGGGNGGNGNRVEISATTAFYQRSDTGAFIGATFDSRGGDGAKGGDGGVCIINHVTNFNSVAVEFGTAPTYLVGYTSFNSSGGGGVTGGGTAGAVTIQASPATDASGNTWIGGLLNETPILAVGGTASGGSGGAGGAATVAAISNVTAGTGPKYDRMVANQGSIDTRGGQGTSTGGNGGNVSIGDRVSVNNEGSVNTSGGTGGTGNGGNAGGIYIWSDGTARNAAALTADGGNSTDGAGGNGPPRGLSVFFLLTGLTLTHDGDVSARGGTSTNGAGGNGAEVSFSSHNGLTPSTLSGTVDVQAGTGTPVGVEGTVRVDGSSVPLTGGAVGF
jgi:hypothetical protein